MKTKYTINKYFNMIEVVLAMAVIALAMTSVMALLPVGLNASRDAIGLNYSADASADIIGRMKTWSEGYSNDYRYNELFSNSSSNYFLPTTLPDAATITKINTASSLFNSELKAGLFSNTPSSTNFDKLNTGLYRLNTTYPGYNDLKNIFFIIQGRMDTNGNPLATVLDERTAQSVKIEVDFVGMVYIWKSQPHSSVNTSGSWTTWPPSSSTDYDFISTMNVEISWPVALNYLERERCYYYSDVRKPN